MLRNRRRVLNRFENTRDSGNCVAHGQMQNLRYMLNASMLSSVSASLRMSSSFFMAGIVPAVRLKASFVDLLTAKNPDRRGVGYSLPLASSTLVPDADAG